MAIAIRYRASRFGMYRDGKLEATVAIALMRAIGGPSKDLDRESILAGESLVGAILGYLP